MPLKIGLISDTHLPEAGRALWPQVFDAFAGVDMIFHGGDVHEFWVLDQLQRSGFKPQSIERFETEYKARFVNTQIDLSLQALARVDDKSLVKALTTSGESLRSAAICN